MLEVNGQREEVLAMFEVKGRREIGLTSVWLANLCSSLLHISWYDPE